jgi:hypothetical protein
MIEQPATGRGLRLSAGFYRDVIGPMLAEVFPDLRYDAALINGGSDVLGYDTPRSTDHGFGPRMNIFLGSGEESFEAVVALIEARLPEAYEGFPTRFTFGGPIVESPPHQVAVTTVAAWTKDYLGVDATGDLRATDWLGVPWQLLATTTAGAVFHDGLGDVSRLRARLAWYPDDVWRYVLAGQWLRISQEEPFVGRTGEVGDDIGSAVLTARLARDVIWLAFLLRRRYPPYAKWLGTAFAELPDYPVLAPLVTGALRARDWRDREEYLCRAYEHVAAQQNELAICAPVPPHCQPFWDRPFRVIGGERFSEALLAAITSPEMSALPLIGSIDQIADSTDVLSAADRAAAISAALWSPPRTAGSTR